jgi:opacity protein-like surface antigen
MKKLIFVVVTAIVLSAAPAGASSDSQIEQSGFIGVFYPRITFRGDNQPDTGDGVGIKFGGIIGKSFGAYLSAFRTWHDDGSNPKAVFTGLTGDFKLSVPLFRLVAPYGSAGLGRYVLENRNTVYRGNQEGSGINGYQVGAGLDFRLSELFTFTVGYTKRRMEFDSGTPGGIEIHQQIREYDAELAVHFR